MKFYKSENKLLANKIQLLEAEKVKDFEFYKKEYKELMNKIKLLETEKEKESKELEFYKNEKHELLNQITLLNIENEKLKYKLTQSQVTIESLNNQNINSYQNINEINDLKQEIKSLKFELEKLKEKNQEEILVNRNNIMNVHFMSTDQVINYAVTCLNTDTFADVEEKLYLKYEEYRETNNSFVFNGKIILRFKKISEIGIKDGDKVQLIQLE